MDIYDDYSVIPEFPEYCVTIRGEVIKMGTGRVLTQSPTMAGELTVGLSANGRQCRRSVKVLVARAFVEGETDIFDTPIQLDGNRDNLNAANIMWRPRWFAWKYIRQMEYPYPDWYHTGPIMDVTGNQRYHSILEAAMTEGLLCEDIRESMYASKRVFPTAQIFVHL